MGKVIERTLVSLDGIIGDPHVWALPYFDKAAQDDALAELMASDAMLMAGEPTPSSRNYGLPGPAPISTGSMR